jgi:hypothetical protein
MKMDSLEKYEDGFVGKSTDISLWDPVPSQDIGIMGKKFGHLVVTGAVHLNGDVQYICKCKCGRSTNATQAELEGGQKVDCGCIFAENMNNETALELLKRRKKSKNQKAARKKRREENAKKLLKYIGAKYGKLTIWALAGRTRKDKELQFRCMCDCGNETIKRYSNVIGGKTKSCGCIRHVDKIEIVPWKQYGNMLAIKKVPKETSRHASWVCKCVICGHKKEVRVSRLKMLVSSKTCNCAGYKKRAQRKQMNGKKAKIEAVVASSKMDEGNKRKKGPKKEEKTNGKLLKESNSADLEIEGKTKLAKKQGITGNENGLQGGGCGQLQFCEKAIFDPKIDLVEGIDSGPTEWFEGL